MAPSANSGTDPWEIFRYEVKMLTGLKQQMNSEGFNSDGNLVSNATVESACVHTRILVDILLSKDSGKGDDIKLNQLVPGSQHYSSVARLRAAYGDNNTDQSPCWILNKMIAHPTLKRRASYDYTSILSRLFPLIDEVLLEIENQHQPVAPNVSQRTIGGLYPGFCAKTC